MNDQCFYIVLTQLYIQWQQIYSDVHKKTSNKILSIPFYAFNNCQATYQNEFCLLFKKSGNFFHTVNVQIDLTPTLFVFGCFLRTPLLPSTMKVLFEWPLSFLLPKIDIKVLKQLMRKTFVQVDKSKANICLLLRSRFQ